MRATSAAFPSSSAKPGAAAARALDEEPARPRSGRSSAGGSGLLGIRDGRARAPGTRPRRARAGARGWWRRSSAAARRAAARRRAPRSPRARARSCRAPAAAGGARGSRPPRRRACGRGGPARRARPPPRPRTRPRIGDRGQLDEHRARRVRRLGPRASSRARRRLARPARCPTSVSRRVSPSSPRSSAELAAPGRRTSSCRPAGARRPSPGPRAASAAASSACSPLELVAPPVGPVVVAVLRQQRAPVERERGAVGGRRSARRASAAAPSKRVDVDLGLEAERLLPHLDRVRAQGAPRDVHRLVQVVRRRRRLAVAPQRVHRLLAVQAVVRREGQQLDQLARLLQAPGRLGDRLAVDRGGEAPEEGDRDRRHVTSMPCPGRWGKARPRRSAGRGASPSRRRAPRPPRRRPPVPLGLRRSGIAQDLLGAAELLVEGVVHQLGLGLLEALGHAAAGLDHGLEGRVGGLVGVGAVDGAELLVLQRVEARRLQVVVDVGLALFRIGRPAGSSRPPRGRRVIIVPGPPRRVLCPGPGRGRSGHEEIWAIERRSGTQRQRRRAPGTRDDRRAAGDPPRRAPRGRHAAGRPVPDQARGAGRGRGRGGRGGRVPGRGLRREGGA